MSVRVINRFEAVQIEHQHCKLCLAAGGEKAFIEPLLEESPIGQSTQRIVPRELKRFLFGFDTRMDLWREVAVATKAINHQCYAEHKNYEDDIVDFPVGIIEAELKKVRWEIEEVGGSKNSYAGCKENQCVPCVRPLPIKPGRPEGNTLR
jgi:hypothetical protein